MESVLHLVPAATPRSRSAVNQRAAGRTRREVAVAWCDVFVGHESPLWIVSGWCDPTVAHRWAIGYGVSASSSACADPTLAGSGFDQPTADCVAGELHSVVHVELLEDVRAMALDGLDADHQRVGDLLVAVALGDQLDDLLLAGDRGSSRKGSPLRSRTR